MVARSDSVKELAAALAKAQAEMQAAHRSRTVNVKTDKGSYSFDYATLDDVWDAIRDPLTKNGLSIAQAVSVNDALLSVDTTLLHQSGEFIGSKMEHRLGTIDLQKMGSAITYLRRYSLCALVGVTSDEDDDGNSAVGNEASVQQRAKPATNGEAKSNAPTPQQVEAYNRDMALLDSAKTAQELAAAKQCLTKDKDAGLLHIIQQKLLTKKLKEREVAIAGTEEIKARF